MKNLRNVRDALSRPVVCLLTALLLLAIPNSRANAEGVFINAPDRKDIAYDDVRGVLYISAGAQLLRYQVATRMFLEPISLGAKLSGLDISPDGQSLVVTDSANDPIENWIYIVSLGSLQAEKVTFPLNQSTLELGTFAAAYGSSGGILISSDGGGLEPLRWYDPATRTTKTVAQVWHKAMLRANADHTLIAIAEVGVSDGPFDRYRVSDGNLLRKSGYVDGTSSFNYEIAVRPDGQQYAIPTGNGTFILDAALKKTSSLIGSFSGGVPVGLTYDPVKPIVYFPWSTTSLVYAYDSVSLTALRSYDFETPFGNTGGFAFVNGRAKTSSDGSLLFVTVDGGVRFVTLDAMAPSALSAVASDATVTLQWQASSNATSYVVYAGIDPRIEASTPVLTGVTGTTAVLSGLTNNTKYYFSVAAQTPAGLSTPSTEAVATPIPVPGAVAGFSAAITDGQLSVSWQATPGAATYVLYEGTAAGAETVFATGLTGVSYTAPLAVNGTPIYLQLAAVNATGTGPRTAELVVQPAKPPVSSVTPGAYPGRQVVQLFSPTPNATIRYTTDGSMPGPYSQVYFAPLQIVTTTTVKAYASAPGSSNSSVASFLYSIGGAGTTVDMTSAYDVGAIAVSGQSSVSHGIDTHGYSYSAELLGRTLVWSGSLFNIGAPGVLDASSGVALGLPAGQYGAIKLLATGINGTQSNQVFVVTYADGSTQTFVQTLSDWGRPTHAFGESIALAMAYRQTPAGGQQSGPFNLYGYVLPLDSTKLVKSVTLPANRNVVVMAISLDPAPAAAAVLVDLSPAANTDAVSYGSPTLFKGLDGSNYAYAGQVYPSYIVWSSVPFQRPTADTFGAIEHTTAPLPSGKFSRIYILGTGFKGAQINRTLVVSYTDGSSDSFVQSFSDWGSPQHYPGEAIVTTMNYRVGLYGVMQSGHWNIYGYTFSLNAAKTVRSITMPTGNVAALSITLDP